MTNTMRNLLIVVVVLFLLCLVLTIALPDTGIKMMFGLFALVWGVLLIWLVFREEKSRTARKNARPHAPRVNPTAAGVAADTAFGVSASTACKVNPSAPGHAMVSNSENEGNAQDAATTPVVDVPAQAENTHAADAPYIGHIESKKFHLATCQTLPHEENRVYLQSREEAIAGGYTPCSYCNP